MNAIGIIPARYASTRFPGKPLAQILGKSMIRRVWDQAHASGCLDRVIVATDDERIYAHVTGFGGEVRMTSAAHPSGTDRIQEVMEMDDIAAHHYNIVVNIQGDEPFLRTEHLRQLISSFEDADTEIATLGKLITDPEMLHDPNAVKVVRDSRGFALYFSRSAIPYYRNAAAEQWVTQYGYLKHLGLYAYRSAVLKAITALPPGKLETAESLEQLRWLENGYRIRVRTTDFESLSVDRPEDLVKIQNEIQNITEA